MRSCACVTAARLSVRAVLCSSSFLLVPPLPSTDSAADRSALFAGFTGTFGESDFSAPCIIGYDLRSSRCGPSACQGLRRRGARPALAVAHRSALPSAILRASALRTMFAPLNGWPARIPVNASRTASRQFPAHDSGCGSLDLHCNGLAPLTSCSCRSPGAPKSHASLAFAPDAAAFPWETAPRYLLRDGDKSYGPAFRDRVKAMGHAVPCRKVRDSSALVIDHRLGAPPSTSPRSSTGPSPLTSWSRADEVRARRQSQDRKGAGNYNSAIGVAAVGRADRVIDR
jgi:hypothetical protein